MRQDFKAPNDVKLWHPSHSLKDPNNVSLVVSARGLVTEITPLTVLGGIQTGIVSATLSGGTPGELYRIDAEISDLSNRRETVSYELHVLETNFSAGGAQPSGFYANGDAFITRYGLEETIRLTDRLGRGVVDTEILQRALLDSQSEIDAALSPLFVTPLSLPVPQPIEQAVCALTRETLLLNNALVDDAIAQQAQMSRDMLSKLVRGQMSLIGLTKRQTGTLSETLFHAEKGIFDADAMRGF